MSKNHRYSRRSRPRSRRRTDPGGVPGTVRVSPNSLPCTVCVMAYDEGHVVAEEIRDLNALRPFLDKYKGTWIDVDGLGDAGVICRLEAVCGLHARALEDVVNTHQRAKVEAYDT